MALLFGLGLICSAQDANAAVGAVWANDGEDKVTQDELRASNSTPVANSLWNGNTISLFGAKNEVVNFNLILEAPLSPATNVGISISNLTGPGGSIIRYSPRSTGNLFNWTSTEIEIFYVRYLQINGSSGFGGTVASFQEPTFPARSQCPANEAAGCAWTDRPVANKFYPDIAVPIELAPNFSIAAGNNQSIWVDIYIPTTVTAGIYTGTVTITENGTTTQTVPVSLVVRNFSLPDSPTSKTMLYSSTGDLNPRYGFGSATTQAMKNQIGVAHRHKISMIDGNWDDGWNGDAPAVQWIPFLDGSAFSAANGYAGPGTGVGNGVFSIGTYGGMTGGTTQSVFTAHFNGWESWFAANAPLTERFVYLCDEANCQSGTPDLPTQLGWWSAIQGPGGNLPTMATQPLLNVASTTLSRPTSGYVFGETAPTQAAANSVNADPLRKLFAYNGGRPGSGSFATEDAGVALRELPWAQYKKGVDRWFFWETTYYNDYQNGMGNTDVFTSARTFGVPDPDLQSSYGQSTHFNNGDGLLFYPGTDQVFPSSSYGINGPIASLRLKHWRRGIQDVDYLVLASQINPTAVQNLVAQRVPKALWENQCSFDPDKCSFFTGPVSWSENPDDWESARSALANIIETANLASTTTSLSASPNPTAFGNPVTFTATVAAGAGTPTGTVTFWPLGTGTLSNGIATFSTSSLPVGSHSVTAIYSGGSTFASSTSTPLTQTVDPGTLQVNQVGSLVAAGSQGGPYSPASFQFQLSADAGSIGYSISGVPNWLTASSSSGSVTPTPTTITFTVNSNANSLAPGNYTATITFTNSTNGLGTQSRSVALGINQSNQGGGGNGAQNAGIWATGPLAKIQQTNSALGGAQSLQISASRNEFADFQVHALPTANSIQMNVSVGDFTNSQAGYVIPSATNVVLYREAYLNITNLSDQNGTLGLTPDPLIPTVDPYTGQMRNAFPVTVLPNQTQSAWIDVLVPQGAPAGNYTGTVTISDGGNVIGQIAVTLKVWAFTLPSTATLKSALGVGNGMCIQAFGAGSDRGYSECAQYPGSGGNSDRAIELIYRNEAKLVLDHRTSLAGVALGPPSSDWNHYDATYGDLLGGTVATLLKGAALTTTRYTPPGYTTNASVVQDWVSHFTANGWLGALFDFTCDGCAFSDALTREQAIHAGSTALKTLVTANIANATQNNLLADLNIIMPTVNEMEPQGGSNQRSSYDSFLSGPNKHLWWQQTCLSHGGCGNGFVGPATSTWPSYMIDASAVRNRVFQWLAFIDRIEGESYYGIDYCWSNNCGPNSNINDPWISVYQGGGNGDGTLIYPGTPAKIGGTTPVPLPSIRLKLIRDGMQDFEYLHALSRVGHEAFARTTAASFITNAYTFNNDPLAMTNAREALGDQLNQLVPAVTLTSSLNPSTFGQLVTFTATVAASNGAPTGTVTFSDGASQLGPGALSGGIATFSTASLPAGSHSITAVYSGDGNFATSTSAPLTQTVNTGNMQVSPATGIAAAGYQGGSFSPASFQYQLSVDAGSIDYSISGVPSWLTVSPASGKATTTPTTITFTVNSTASSLMAGNYNATVTFTDSTNGQGNLSVNAALTVSPAPALQLSPATTISASGNQGGPFSPLSFQYQLSASTGSVGYSISGIPAWLTASSTSGTLTTTATTITFAVNANANNLLVGTYNATISFANTTYSQVNQIISAALNVNSARGLQTSRTYVSGVGDDLSPCSRTAPCKTFAGAISQTSATGEIDCLDPGGYGTLTITKSITIDCTGTFGSILSSGTNGVTIDLSTSPDTLKSVVLRGLSINGTGGGAQSGLKGVSILSAAVVTLEDVVIMNHSQQGVADTRTAPGKLFIKNSVIRNNTGVGIVVVATGGTNLASIENTHSINNLYGLATGSGNQVKVTNSVFSGNSVGGIEADPGAQVRIQNTTVNFNGIGLQGYGAVWLSDTDISFNTTGISGQATSFGDNKIYGNGSAGTAPTVGAASIDHGEQ